MGGSTINRREVIASGFALSLLAPGTATSRFVAGQRGQPAALHHFVADGFDAAALAAAEAAASQGAAVMLTGADLTPVYNALDDVWRRALSPVAGVTTTSTAFVLERLALHHHLRVAYRGGIDPDPSVGGALVDRLHAALERPRHLPALAPPRSAHDRDTLVSWLFAPRRA